MNANTQEMKQISMEERDFLLWRYLHEDVTLQEKESLELLLSTDMELKKAFENIKAEETIFSSIEMDSPSLRFTKNVMESIEKKAIAKPARTYINTNIIRLIGGGFIAFISLALLFVMTQIKWTSSSEISASTAKIALPSVTINWSFANGSYWLYGFFAILLVCFFVLMDSILLNKKKYKTT